MLEHFHLISSIHSSQDGYTFSCRCNVEQYDKLATFVYEGEKPVECPFFIIRRTEQVVEYEVVIPELPGDKYVFYARWKNGEKRGVWKPDVDLDPTLLPSGFIFQGIFLNLVYEKKGTIHPSSENLHKFNVLFTKIEQRKYNLCFSGYVFLPEGNCDVSSLQMKIIKFREENVQTTHPVTTLPDNEKVFGIFRPEYYKKYRREIVYKIVCTVDMEIIKKDHGFFNIFIEHNNVLVTPSNYYQKLVDRDHLYPARLSLFKRALIVPFYNDFFNRWRLDVYHLSLFDWLRVQVLRLRCRYKPIEKNKNVWLLGEYANTARDNGMHFKNYLCRQKGTVKAYYVITRDSEQRHNLQGRNVVYFGSYKHFAIAAKAGVLVFSHMPEFLLPKSNRIVRYGQRLSQFKTVFIQHGIIATTAIVLLYQKKVRNLDRFIVSSSLEKKNICKYLGYNNDEVVVTGLARWDKLLAISEKSNNILIMPTYRNDLDNVSEEVFKQSNFFKFWNTLMSNEDFLCLIQDNNISVNFFLHIGLARFAHCFELPPGIRQVNDKNIQKLLGTCGLMVTDYSSVAFDVLIQDKPVVFCPFDYDAMMELRKGPKFIDYEKDLPGPVCYNIDTAVYEIIKHVENGYKIDSKYRDRRKKFFDHIDNQNCDRLYKEISRLIEL